MDKKEARLARRREQDRNRRASENAQEREIRLSRRRERNRARRAERSSEERDRLHRQRRVGLQRESPDQRDARVQRLRHNKEQRLATETSEEREIRLQTLRSAHAQRIATETIEERERRLQLLRDNQAQRIATETIEERERRLQLLSDNQAQRIATETIEERERRLQALRENREQRLISESEESRSIRLCHLSSIASNSRRHALEDEEEAEERRQEERDRQRRHRELERLRPQTALARANVKIAKFHSNLATLHLSSCSICLERSHVKKTLLHETEHLVCTRCKRDKQSPKVYSRENNMDPGSVPQELLGLTQVEEMLVAAVMPMMSIYRLPYGQYGYSGHVINFPQYVLSFAATLPRLPSQLDVIVVRKERADAVQSHRDFRVRRFVVERALRYLVANNKYYRANHVQVDEDALAQLPEDGSFFDILSVSVASNAPEEEEKSEVQPADQMRNDSEQQSDELVRSFVPNATQQRTEQETVRQFVQGQPSSNQTSSSTLMWPSIGGRPINEFKTEGYFSCAFPTLYPTGAAEFLGARQRNVTIGNYFKHLMMYDDGRFAKHPRFRFFALNTEMRWRAIQTGRVYVRQHPGDAHLSVDALRDMVGREGESFSNRVLHYATSLRGTKQYWFRQRNQLMSMVDTLGLPTIFFTHKANAVQL